MASGSDDAFVILTCSNLNPIEADITEGGEIMISTKDIQSWDLDTILHHQTVKVHASRHRLIEQSSYFQGLLSRSFSESRLDCILVQWNVETFINVLRSIYGWPLDVTSDNFLALFESALYFGVEMLILKCRTWFSAASMFKDKEQRIHLEDLIHIWNFGLDHANDFVPELCARYLARNFMLAMSHKYFVNIPYNLLLDSVKHPCLTVDSEMLLCDALLLWSDANIAQLDFSSRTENDLTVILEEIRISILPLWFAAGRRRSSYFSKLADESVNSILSLVKVPPTSLINVLEDVVVNSLRIRLTEYSKKVDLSGCPQMTWAILFLSVLDSSHHLDHPSRKILERLDKDQSQIPPGLLPTLSFEAVQEVDISKCHALHLESAFECFSKSFPSLRTIKAAHLLNLKTTAVHKLVQKCPLLCEVDLTVDPSPVIPTKVSIVSSSPALRPLLARKSIVGDGSLYATSVFHSGPSLLNITKLILEGRSDICGSGVYFKMLCFFRLHKP